MSELVARIHKLNNDISLLREQVLEERRKYVDEVDHSDQLAHFLSLSHNGKNCGSFCSFCDVIRTHENRRLDDYKNSFKIAAELEEAEASME
jgi:hypothetical protein